MIRTVGRQEGKATRAVEVGGRREQERQNGKEKTRGMRTEARGQEGEGRAEASKLQPGAQYSNRLLGKQFYSEHPPGSLTELLLCYNT